ncbi:MAG: uroporphyrinogen decarboxylase [Hyphomicrobiaceae bacterium]|nr:uroporphyrinogen decarboxylase [Hyphomicrobiaceae bacterium]MCC0024278.1 uroporphyrinogen decarboxylase [Hyphomicrobiaceae bacterium]
MGGELAGSGKVLLDCVRGQRQERPPIWIMRQAGRYLPEYREVRQGVSGFLELCFTPEKAIEVTLQPLRRFDLDAAILFSDILVIPHALGQKVWFEAGEGPRLEELSDEILDRMKAEKAVEALAAVLEALSGIRAALPGDKTLIGFCGAPWTVATYMIGGRGSSDQAAARLFALQQPEKFQRLMNVLVEASIHYLVAQFKAGADVVQVFESWAANLDESSFVSYVIGPMKRIVENVRKEVPNAAIIGFPRGAPSLLSKYVAETGVDMVGIDYATPVGFVDKALTAEFGVQGNLDPLRVVAGGSQMFDEAERIIAAWRDRPHVFNLGHGIVPSTPIEHVAQLVEFVKTGKRGG